MKAILPFPDISPEIVSITIFGFDLALRWYALAYIVGILLGYFLARAALKRPHLWPGDQSPMTLRQVEDFLFWLILGIVIGGRLGYVFLYRPGYYLSHPGEIPMLWQGGMAFHGGMMGVAVAVFAWCRVNRVSIGSAADMLALAAPIGIMLGRIANFINAELWGRPTDVPWAVIFPGPAAQDCPGVIGLCARHPSQLYEAALEGALLALILTYVAWRLGALKRRWLLTGMFLAGYGAARFVVEYFRLADAQYISPDNPFGHVIRLSDSIGVTMGQVLSLPMLGAGLIIIIAVLRRPRA